jgi:hypothetical protein
MFHQLWKMPLLKFVATRDLIPAVTIGNTTEAVNEIVAGLDPNSELVGGEDASNMVKNIMDMGKSEVLYTLPLGNLGNDIYYAEVPSYRIETDKFIRLVIYPKQRIIIENTHLTSYVRVLFLTKHTDGSVHHDTKDLHPGQSLVR